MSVQKNHPKSVQLEAARTYSFEPMSHPDAELSREQTKELFETLLKERERALAGLNRHLGAAISDIDQLADEIDIATRHTEQAYLLRFADKERKLLREISRALNKLQSGDYGLCEGTEEPVGYERLKVRPWTRYSIEYKEQLERRRNDHV